MVCYCGQLVCVFSSGPVGVAGHRSQVIGHLRKGIRFLTAVSAGGRRSPVVWVIICFKMNYGARFHCRRKINGFNRHQS